MKFFTFFSESYLPKAHVLLESLCRHNPDAEIICCLLDPGAEKILDKFPDVHHFFFSDILESNPKLKLAITNRTFSDQIFTSVADMTSFALSFCREDELLTYLDADIGVFQELDQIESAMVNYSAGGFEHLFSGALKRYLLRYGRFNAGAFVVRNDLNARSFLEAWASACYTWCYDFPSRGRYSNQGHLSVLLETERYCTSLAQFAANVAPWNSSFINLDTTYESPRFRGKPIMFFHYHGLVQHGSKWYLGHLRYLKFLRRRDKTVIYGWYLERLRLASTIYDSQISNSPRLKSRTGMGWLTDYSYRLISRILGQTIKSPSGA